MISKTEKRRKVKLKAIEYKGSSCFDCGNLFIPDVFEFHHLDPKKKDFEPYKMRDMSWARAKKELDKCVMLCANCHRMRHFIEKENKL